ncbi:MAG: hypothetical protein ACR2JI_17755 [Mycobacterium sp.]
MSRNSQAKKARRKKRQTTREARWTPTEPAGALDDPAAQLLSAAEQFDDWIVSRGWTFDEENSAEGLATWFYEPSAIEIDDEDEPVTRVWFTVNGGEDDFPNAVNAVLVGSDEDDGVFTLSPDLLVQRVAEIEAYRPGDPRPLID